MVHLEPPRTVTLKSLDFIDFLAVLGEENDQEPQQKKATLNCNSEWSMGNLWM